MAVVFTVQTRICPWTGRIGPGAINAGINQELILLLFGVDF
jgi:hypothetical protein